MAEFYALANLDARAYLHPRDSSGPESLYELAGSANGYLERLIIMLTAAPEAGGWAGQRLVLIGDYQHDHEWLERAGISQRHVDYLHELDRMQGRQARPSGLHAALERSYQNANDNALERIPPYDPARPDLTSLDTLVTNLDTNAHLDPRALPGYQSSTPHPAEPGERISGRWRLTTSTALALLLAEGDTHHGPWAGHHITLTPRQHLSPTSRDDTPLALHLLHQDPFFKQALNTLPQRERSMITTPASASPVTRSAPPRAPVLGIDATPPTLF